MAVCFCLFVFFFGGGFFGGFFGVFLVFFFCCVFFCINSVELFSVFNNSVGGCFQMILNFLNVLDVFQVVHQLR